MSTCSIPARINAGTRRGTTNQIMLRPFLTPRSGSDGSFQYAAPADTIANVIKTKAERSRGGASRHAGIIQEPLGYTNREPRYASSLMRLTIRTNLALLVLAVLLPLLAVAAVRFW